MSEQISLKKDSWHAKWMNYTFGYKPYDFNYMCPYFWMLILSFVLSPIILLYKFILKPILYLIGYIYSIIDDLNTKRDKEQREIWLNQLKFDEVFYRNSLNKAKWTDKFKEFVDWYLYNNDLELYRKFIQDVAQYSADHPTTSNKEKIAKIVRYTQPVLKWLLYIIMGAIALLVAYVLYKFVLFLMTLPVAAWGNVFAILGIVIVIVFVAIVVVKYVVIDAQENKTHFVAKASLGVVNGIRNFFKFIGQLYKDSCPPITWK